MMIPIDNLWQELTADAARIPGSVMLIRRLMPEANVDLFIGLEQPADLRLFFSRIGHSALPKYRNVPVSRAVEGFSIVLDEDEDRVAIGVRLKDNRYSDVFDGLVNDLVIALMDLTTDAAVAETMSSRLRRWQRLFEAEPSGLSVEGQIGLFGELLFLEEYLIPALGAEAIDTWVGPQGGAQDFAISGASIEIKTCCDDRRCTVRISSEQQLDDGGVPGLYLQHIVLQEAKHGRSLPDLVGDLRQVLVGSPVQLDTLTDLLIQAGYADTQADQYAARKYDPLRQDSYRVVDGFPRITKGSLPLGVLNVSYELSLSFCERFRIAPEDLANVLGS